MTVHGLTRTAPLANGFRPRFSYAPDTGLLVEWFPAPPRMIRSWTDRRRFLAVYGRAKEAFSSEIQVLTGARVDAADYIDELGWEDPPPQTGRPQMSEPKVGSRRGKPPTNATLSPSRAKKCLRDPRGSLHFTDDYSDAAQLAPAVGCQRDAATQPPPPLSAPT